MNNSKLPAEEIRRIAHLACDEMADRLDYLARECSDKEDKEAKDFFEEMSALIKVLGESVKFAGLFGGGDFTHIIFPRVRYDIENVVDTLYYAVGDDRHYREIIEKILAKHGIDASEYEEAWKNDPYLAERFEIKDCIRESYDTVKKLGKY